jgi:hypothetical protein
MGNGTAFLKQAQQPAINLISSLEKRRNQRSSIKQNLVRPNFNLVLAVTYETLVEGNGIHATQVSSQDTVVLFHYP